MVLMGQSQGALHTSALFAALGLVLLATWAILGVAPALTARLGAAGTLLLTKVMALILIVIGVQFVVDGLRPIAIDIVRSAMAPKA
jgi:multiple antibiotic resistance protein